MWRSLLILVGATLLVGCPDGGDKDLPGATGSPTTGSPTTGSPTTSTGPSPTTTGSSTGGSSTTSCTTACEATTAGTTGPAEPFDPCATGGGFLSHDSCCNVECDPDIDCDVWAQNCPDGEKCVAWQKEAWNGTHCSAVDPNPKSVGEPCTVKERGIKLDDCEEGAVCWNGVCTPQCTGNADAPMCPPGATCAAAISPNLHICLPSCDPLQQDCAVMGEACYPVNNTFVCAVDASGGSGTQGDSCSYINVCDPGLVCVWSPACDGCCSALCQLDVDYTTEGAPSPKCPDPAMGCIAWYEPGEAPPGLENVGVCQQP